MSTNTNSDLKIITKNKIEQKHLLNLNRYFIFENENSILDILSRENGKWQHPFILNYTKCMICKENKKSIPYHLSIDIKSFFKENKIKIRHKNDFKSRITNRYINSDTEEYSDNFEPLGMISDTGIIVECRRLSQIDNEISVIDCKKEARSEKGNNEKDAFLNIPTRSTPFIKSKISTTYRSTYNRHQTIQKETTREKDLDKEYFSNVNEKYQSQLDTNMIKVSINKIDYCDICFGDIKDKFILSCGDFYCRECIKAHIKSSLQNITLFKNIKCPKTICNNKIKENDIEKLFSQEEFKKYLKFKAKIEGYSDNTNIPCPVPDCEGFGKKINIKNGNLKCSKNHMFCVRCMNPSHANKKCSKSADYSTQIMSLFKQIKKCPNCKTLVEKEEGCNNVTCGNIWCNYTFCWVCMNSYDKNHYSNPLSPCFGMQELQPNSRFAKHKCLRISKCLLIFLLMLVILPIVILMFSFFVLVFYILAFVLDGSAVKNLKLKTERKQKFFKFLIYSIYSWISVASIPLGYWALCLLIVSSPFIFLYKKLKHDDKD